jgi:hypothetical protein
MSLTFYVTEDKRGSASYRIQTLAGAMYELVS